MIKISPDVGPEQWVHQAQQNFDAALNLGAEELLYTDSYSLRFKLYVPDTYGPVVRDTKHKLDDNLSDFAENMVRTLAIRDSEKPSQNLLLFTTISALPLDPFLSGVFEVLGEDAQQLYASVQKGPIIAKGGITHLLHGGRENGFNLLSRFIGGGYDIPKKGFSQSVKDYLTTQTDSDEICAQESARLREQHQGVGWAIIIDEQHMEGDTKRVAVEIAQNAFPDACVVAIGEYSMYYPAIIDHMGVSLEYLPDKGRIELLVVDQDVYATMQRTMRLLGRAASYMLLEHGVFEPGQSI